MLLTPGSVLTLTIVYHPLSKFAQEILSTVPFSRFSASETTDSIWDLAQHLSACDTVRGRHGPDPVPGLLARATEVLEAEFAALPAFEPTRRSTQTRWRGFSRTTAHRLGDNYPYFHPLYAGQMLKPPHPVARAAYALAMKINPNNHARDGGRASSEMEIEAVREIAAMFGWTEFLGHLTRAAPSPTWRRLWVAGQLAPGKRIVGSEQAHYTHQRSPAC